MDTKICSACNENKPISQYGKVRSNGEKLKNNCKSCCNSRLKEYHENKQKNIVDLKTVKELFVKLFKIDKLYNIEEMNWNSKFHYAINFDKSGDLWLPVTLRAANKESRYDYLNLPESGIVICWRSDNEIAWYDVENWNKDLRRITWSKVILMTDHVVKSTELLNSIKNHFSDIMIDKFSSLSSIKDLITIEKENYNGLDIENVFNDFLKRFDKIIKCPEWCNADYYYGDEQFVMPIQIKSSQTIPRQGDFTFKMRSNYPDMLIVLRHNTLNMGCIVMPGNDLRKTSVCGTISGKYGKYIVEDDQLQDFIEKVYDNIVEGNKTYLWPKGVSINIENIKLIDRNDIVIPKHKLHKIEKEYALIRIDKLPNLLYSLPHRDGSPVDIIINDVRIQDKIAHTDQYNNNIININKSNGRKKRQSYHEGDFDVLYIHMPDKLTFYLIPSYILLENKLFDQTYV